MWESVQDTLSGVESASKLQLACNQTGNLDVGNVGPLGIDYLHLYTCTFEHAPVLGMILILLWLSFLFFLVSDTADAYFSPTMSTICEKLNISYDVAGVTFLAFGNGGPDVFSSVAAFSSGSQDIGLNSLLGGGVFISTVVVGCVVLTTPVTVQPTAFIRDCISFVIAILVLVVLAVIREISFAASFVFVVCYGLYVITVVLLEYLHQRKLRYQRLTDKDEGIVSAFWHVEGQQGIDPAKTSEVSFITRPDAEVKAGGGDLELSGPISTKSNFTSKMVHNYFPPGFDSGSLALPLISNDELEGNISPNATAKNRQGLRNRKFNKAQVWDSLYWSHMRWRRDAKRRLSSMFEGDRSFFSMLIVLPKVPFTLLRDCTIPMLEPASWSRVLAAMFPTTCSLFLMLLNGHFFFHESYFLGMHTWAWIMSMGLGLSCVVFYTTHRSRPPSSFIYFLFFLSLAFIMSIAWIYLLASEVVTVLIAMGRLTQVNSGLLGLTVLAWGNSLGDLVANLSVAKAGFPEMAIAGCFGGPLFNLLIGGGLCIVYSSWTKWPEPYVLKLDVHAWTSIVFLLTSLGISMYMVSQADYRCTKKYGKVLLSLYLVFTLVTVMELF